MKYIYKESLGLLSRSISKALGKKLEQKLKKHNINITAEQWSVMSMLQYEKESSQKNISLIFGYDKVMVLRIVRGLESIGVVKKRVCTNDKRTRIVTLTDKGHAFYGEILPIAEATLNEAYRGLSEREIEFYAQISELIVRNLEIQ